MRKWVLLPCLVVFPLVASAYLFVFGGARRVGDTTLRTLRDDQIRPILEQIAGKGLPDKASDLRAIAYEGSGLQELYLTFHTDPCGCSYILQQFGVEGVERYDFPDEDNCHSFPWGGLASFERGCDFQKKLEVALFDNTLYDGVVSDALQCVDTGVYPDDAVSGHYLHLYDDTQPLTLSYQILVFPKREIVYMCVARRPKGLVLP